MIEQAAERLAIRIHEANREETASVPVLKFALIGLFNNTLTFVLILLAGALLGMFPESLLAFFAFMGLRLFAGGAHFNSAYLCIAVSVATVTAAVFLSVYLNDTLTFASTAVSLLIIAWFAPSNIKKTRIKPSRRPLYKVVSVLIVAANFIIQSPLLALVFLAQAISTLDIQKEVST